MRTALMFIIILLLSHNSIAAISTYEFKDESTKERFYQLTYELRCPKCQNQNLQDSNSPISADLRQEIYRMLESGKTDNEIVNFMVERYGNFIRYRPEVNTMTYFLWYGPFILLAIGIFAIIFISLRSSNKNKTQINLKQEENEQLQKLLDERHD